MPAGGDAKDPSDAAQAVQWTANPGAPTRAQVIKNFQSGTFDEKGSSVVIMLVILKQELGAC